MKKNVFCVGLLALLLLLAGGGNALAVEISEACSSNGASYAGEDKAYPDWIELYNPGAEPVELSDYWLSDDGEEPYLFSLAGYDIAPEGYLVLAADDVTLPFKLSASGCALYLTETGRGTKSVVIPALNTDQTFSRLPDGSYGITEATPGAANAAGKTYVPPVYVAAPRFSRPAGFYDEPFSLTLETFEGGAIYYTLDGSTPTAESARYEGPLYIDDASYHRNANSMLTDIATTKAEPPKTLLPKGTVVRAISVGEDGAVSAAASNTYFVGYQNRESLKGIDILSVIVDPHDMFDADDGIYMLGKRYADWLKSDAYDPSAPFYTVPVNFGLRGRGAEILSAVQLFNADREIELSQRLGLRINGNITRNQPMKSFKLYARKEYDGGSAVEYRFWEDGYKAERIIVKGAAQNGSIAHAIVADRSPLRAKCKPCVLFINGEYWGLYRIWECQDAQYIAQYRGVDKDDVVMIKNGELAEGEKADGALYKAFRDSVRNLICSTEEGYALIDSLIDIDNYTDYLVGELSLNNNDWINNSNNSSLWRTRTVGTRPYQDGRWRWIYQDMDLTCYQSEEITSSLLKENVFSALWTNASYRTKFLTRVMDFANIDGDMDRINAILDAYVAEYRPYLSDSYQRFSETNTLEGFDSRVESIRAFFANRRGQIVSELTSTLRLDRAVHSLTATIDGPADAVVRLNGRELPFKKDKWTGLYFERCPIVLCAEETPGYHFAGWYEDGRLLSAAPQLELKVDSDRAVVAQYKAMHTLLIADAENAPKAGTDGILLRAGHGRYEARFTLESGLSATIDETGALRVAADENWDKGAWFGFSFSAAGYGELSFAATLFADGDVAERWNVEYSADGIEYVKLEELRLEAGENALTFALPDSLGDGDTAYLRFSVRKKARVNGGAIYIRSAALYGAEAGMTLARLIEKCEETLGDAFVPPDLAALADRPQREVDELTDRLRQQLAAALIKAETKTVRQAGLYSDQLEGMDDDLCVTVTAEAARIVSQIRVALNPALYPEGVYAYRWTADEKLSFWGAQTVSDGGILLDASVGTYILLDRKAEALRCQISVRDGGGEADTVSRMVDGVLPDACAFITVARHTAYQENMTILLPDALARNKGGVWLYKISGDALSSEMHFDVRAGETAIETPPLLSGDYLALPQSLNAYRQEAAFQARRAEALKAGAGASRAPSGKWIAAAAAGGLLLTLLIAGIVLVRARRRGRR